jgi:diaminohydroxyphosphoribosylaminopyrimidine deaminase/5-amino-6-(5-phosphoribosylamino)uracil reductase
MLLHSSVAMFFLRIAKKTCVRIGCSRTLPSSIYFLNVALSQGRDNMDWMRLALNLAQQGINSCPPNPMVGCVIIKNDSLVGRGYHKATGSAHAEVLALAQAGSAAEGADVYITLEPCCHFGRTPPCVDALIAAKVRAVHIAIEDPNPKMCGRGIEKLRHSGIAVHVGHCQEEAYRLNLPFFHYITHSFPYVIAKWAMTLDGKMALAHGESKWITGEVARGHAHALRAQMSGIMIGASTLRFDNPQLEARPEIISTRASMSAGMATSGLRQPRPIIVTASGDVPLSATIFEAGRRPLVIASSGIAKERLQAFDERSIEYKLFPLVNDKLHMPDVMTFLAGEGISPLLVEGGSVLLTELFKNECVNEVYTYIAPKIMGGSNSVSPIRGDDPLSMDQLVHLHDQQMVVLDPDVCFMAKTSKTAGNYDDFRSKSNFAKMSALTSKQINPKEELRVHV